MKLGDDSGFGLIRPLLQVRDDMRILLLTGYASIATTVSAIKLGAHDYLSKPASVADIVHALEQSRARPGVGSVEESPIPLRRLEWEHIQRVLERNQGNISAAPANSACIAVPCRENCRNDPRGGSSKTALQRSLGVDLLC